MRKLIAALAVATTLALGAAVSTTGISARADDARPTPITSPLPSNFIWTFIKLDSATWVVRERASVHARPVNVGYIILSRKEYIALSTPTDATSSAPLRGSIVIGESKTLHGAEKLFTS